MRHHAEAPVTIREEGQHTIRAEAVDKAGNKGTKTITVNLDRTPPTGSLTLDGGEGVTPSRIVLLSVSGDDNLSGPFQVRFSNDGKTWSDWEPFQGKVERLWDLTSYGGSDDPTQAERTVWAEIEDVAGNISAPLSAQVMVNPPPGP